MAKQLQVVWDEEVLVDEYFTPTATSIGRCRWCEKDLFLRTQPPRVIGHALTCSTLTGERRDAARQERTDRRLWMVRQVALELNHTPFDYVLTSFTPNRARFFHRPKDKWASGDFGESFCNGQVQHFIPLERLLRPGYLHLEPCPKCFDV